MMRKLQLPVLVLLILALAGGGAPLHAQPGSDLPPTIISFTSSIDTITLADAEAGTETATLAWQVVGVQPENRIVLQAYVINAWESLLTPPAETLTASGSLDVPIQHPHNFGPPTYRLVILDAAGRILEERVLVINYERDPDADAPHIETFETEVESLDAAALTNRTARLNVTWSVQDRLPDSNLVFEQVLEGGRIVSVELPRPNVWVPSHGQGVLVPFMPGAGQPVRLRLRVVDMVDGDTLDEALLPPLEVTRGEVPAPTAQPPVAAPVEVVTFVAVPEIVRRGGTVTITWDVRNATEVGVWLVQPGGPMVRAAPDAGAQGQWTLTLPESFVDYAPFALFATGPSGGRVQESLTVDVICPYTYFFGPTAEQLTCPADSANTVQAAFQRFERGYMIWRADTSEIYVLYDSGLVNVYRDTWQGETLYYPEAAPEGMYRPDRGFGKLWIEHPQVRSGVGWALTLEEGYTMRYQRSGDIKYSRLYLDWPDGTVIYIVENIWRYFDP